ncbi:hypothetical protein ACSBR2_037695 [Camellia fascicularis]
MGFAAKSYCSFLCVMVLLPLVCYSQDAYVRSRATYYGSPDCLGTPTGACGFGEYGRTVYDRGMSEVSRLYRNGTGYGACYQVRCKVPQLCTEDGVRVVVIDYGEGDKTDFILSTRAYSRLARPNAALDLFAYGVVDIEYRRIPCQYPGYNLMVKVHEQNRFLEYLALVMLYQAGQNDITAADVWQIASNGGVCERPRVQYGTWLTHQQGHLTSGSKNREEEDDSHSQAPWQSYSAAGVQ